MKKILLCFFSFIFFSSCVQNSIKNLADIPAQPPKGYGLLLFSVTFLHNSFLKDRIFANLEGIEGGKQLLRFHSGGDDIFAFWVKEGTYFINDLQAESYNKKLTGDNKGKDSVLVEFPLRYKIYVKENSITYGGNIFIHSIENNHKNNTILKIPGETAKLSAQITLRSRKMLDLEKLQLKFSHLKNLSFALVEEKLQIAESKVNAKIENLLRHPNTEQGYRNFKWGTSIQTVKSSLKEDNKRILIISATELIDHSSEECPVEFFFSSQGELEKVVEHLNSFKVEEIRNELDKRFGKALNKENNMWTSPYSLIKLSLTKSDKFLTYTPLDNSQKKSGKK